MFKVDCFYNIINFVFYFSKHVWYSIGLFTSFNKCESYGKSCIISHTHTHTCAHYGASL